MQDLDCEEQIQALEEDDFTTVGKHLGAVMALISHCCPPFLGGVLSPGISTGAKSKFKRLLRKNYFLPKEGGDLLNLVRKKGKKEQLLLALKPSSITAVQGSGRFCCRFAFIF